MKFSVLLPTRNGGAFLENCIRSILEQGYEDMELVISDNANTDQTPQIIRQFISDPRVKTLRLEAPVSVTDNWNSALSASSGDYVLMMGDDDYLLPGYFSRMERLLDKYNQPDCVVHNAYSYVAPGSIADNQQSFYSEAHFQFGPDLMAESMLTREQRFGIVHDMFNFKVRIPLNMQTTLVSRKAFARVGGGLFQKPFPDHYALNALLLTADKWIFSPERLLVVGVSPKSFGHYVYSNKQASGLSYLGIDADFQGRLPGNELMNGMHVWLVLLKQNYSELLKRVEIDRAGYVRRQFYSWFMQRKLGAITARDLLRNLGLLTFSDWSGLAATVFDRASWVRLKRVLAMNSKQSGAEIQWQSLQALEGVTDIRQFEHWLAERNSVVH
ncbi:glycosyltransferase family A protein [Rhodoferax sp.]|uniref:glycosyltransferase family 2 protein n=1 Tax=Rhodoferax sp. TaxID=50421 RepID=UPI001ED797CC|nr:glycosyltransferase family A protein [Rhodoferax sp.]MBT9507350.1 glycosyltransferase family 2 protein [Rhodoferax sp.]